MIGKDLLSWNGFNSRFFKLTPIPNELMNLQILSTVLFFIKFLFLTSPALVGSNFLRYRKKNPVWSSSSKAPCVCVGVRTYSGMWLVVIVFHSSGQQEWLNILLSALLVQSHRSQYFNKLQLKIFLVNTEAHFNSSASFESQLRISVDALNRQYDDRVKFLHSKSTRQFKNPFYGYDETDKLLDFLLLQVWGVGQYSLISFRASVSG